MDYDDNDFQGQNIHLAGEASSKVSPILCPYALPKFDFDDSLQGHLRFDSLVDNEVFLGITSQEDNHWIEDFSRGSSGIEFSSSAAESCSITRRNNVWSEATSSESVEMLLKSVGQEERVIKETIVEESDDGDELRRLTKLMDPMEQGDEMNHDMHANNESIPEKIQEDFPGFSVSAEMEQLQVKFTSKSHEAEFSGGKSDANILNKNCGQSVMEEKLDRKFNDVNQEKVDNLVNESVEIKVQEDPSVSAHCGNMNSSSNVKSSAVELNDQESVQLVAEISIENANGLSKDISVSMAEHVIRRNEARKDDPMFRENAVETCEGSIEKSTCVGSKVECVDDHSVEVISSKPEESTSMPPIANNNLQIDEGSNMDVCSAESSQGSKSSVTGFPSCSKIRQQFIDGIDDRSSPSFIGDGRLKLQAIKVGNEKSDIADSTELNTGSLIEISHVQYFGEKKEDPVGSDGRKVNFDASVVPWIGKTLSEVGDGSINHVRTSLVNKCLSAELLAGKISNEIVVAGNNAQEFHSENISAEDHSVSPLLSDSIRMPLENPSSQPADVCMDQGFSSHEREGVKLPTESCAMNSEFVGSLDIHKEFGPSSSGEGNEGDIFPGSKSDMAKVAEPVAAMEALEIISHDTSGSTHLSSGSETTADVIDEQPKSPIFGVRLSHLDTDEQLGMGVPGGVTDIHETPQALSVSDAPKSEKSASPDSTGDAQHKMIDHCAPLVESCNAGPSEHAAVVNEDHQEYAKNLKVGPVPFDSSTEGVDNAVAVDRENSIELTTERNHGVEHSELAVNLSSDQQASVDVTCPSECGDDHVMQDSGNSVYLGKPRSGLSISISCIKGLETAKEHHEIIKEDRAENAPMSKATSDVQEKNRSVSSNSSTKGENSFTFEVCPSASLGEPSKGWLSFPTIQACNLSMNVEGSSTKAIGGQGDPKVLQNFFSGTPQAPNAAMPVGSKMSSERKSRRRAPVKESSKKGKHMKETTPVKQAGKVEKSSVLLASPVAGQLVHHDELKPNENVERSGTKLCGAPAIPPSNLPDLNNSAPLFQQPFTDMQQVQLRAQIFVYGSLISGTTPEEAHMVAAFGQSEGGRSSWETIWRACLERLHGQKPLANNSDTPVQSRSGNKVSDQATKHGSLQSKSISASTGTPTNKGTPPVVNPMIPLSSPLWNISTPLDGLQSSGMPRAALLDYHHAVSPLHPYQHSPMQSFAGHNPSWLSQGPFPGQWVTSSPVSAFNVGARYSAMPKSEAVILNPMKESGTSVKKRTSATPLIHDGSPSDLSGVSLLPDVKKATVSSPQPSTDAKSRKRKKVAVSDAVDSIILPLQTQTPSVLPVIVSHSSMKVLSAEGQCHTASLAQSQTVSATAPVISNVIAPAVSSIFSTSVSVSTPASLTSKSSPVRFLSTLSPTSSHGHPRSLDQNEDKAMMSEETFSKVEEAKLLAEDASVHAAAAISHCQGVWSQLERQKNAGLVSDVEAKLVSAAASIAAAASVARAAAAAAKIASNAAEQAKLMADEVLLSSGTEGLGQSSIISLPNVVDKFEKATPASILKGGNGNNRPSSIIAAAREAARRRVEAASAASKHADNLDAIVKAAELAAEAVSQAGKIVAMGDPSSLHELVESGPESYWKRPQLLSEQQGMVSNNLKSNFDKKNVEATPNVSSRSESSDKEAQASKCGISLRESYADLIEDQTMVIDSFPGSTANHGKDLKLPQGHKAPELSKTIGVIPESEIGPCHDSLVGQHIFKDTLTTSKESSIREGCLVEVFKNAGNSKAAWFAANVLSLKDGKAFVCYTELRSDEGQLKEWVPVQLEGGTEVPRIRIAHPMTTMRFEGTRKRRRAVVTDYAWSVGDHVDVWMQDCWREGVVTEKNKNDETSLTVQFQAQGEASVIRAWHVRPTLIWKDGEWLEWSMLKGDHSSQGEMPQEKRLKMGSPVVESKGKDKMARSANMLESGKHGESRSLPLSAEEKLFNIGKNSRDENKLDAQRTMRSGLQKEGPRVIFGVPKPGKKQKFMDVSKHYVAERSNKSSRENDSAKFSRYVMPQALGPRGWKSNLKNDAKEKQIAETKSRVLKSRKPQNPSGRTMAPKNNFLTSAKSAASDAVMEDNVSKDSVSVDDNELGRKNLMEFRSSSNTEEPGAVSSLALPPDASRRFVTSNARSERLRKGKMAQSGGKPAKVEMKEKSNPEVVEPRRSNRRIQPTSRLLEGLQSSLTISKVPAAAHDRNQRSQNKATPKG